jgi:hypothetical protein
LVFRVISAKVESKLADKFRQYAYNVPNITDDSLLLRGLPNTMKGTVIGAFVQGYERDRDREQ